jgi:hypothetical protein
MSANLKSLIGRLNDTCRSALEGAAGLCLSRTNYDVDLEHLLVKLGETPDTDFHRILRRFEIDEGRLAKDLVRSLDRLKTGGHAACRARACKPASTPRPLGRRRARCAATRAGPGGLVPPGHRRLGTVDLPASRHPRLGDGAGDRLGGRDPRCPFRSFCR